jgi:HEAT repeat protein
MARPQEEGLFMKRFFNPSSSIFLTALLGSFLAVVGRFQRIKDGEDRVRLLDAMVAGGDRRLRLFLEAALRDRSPSVRRRATWHLGEMGEPASLGPLAKALEQASEDEQLGLVEAIGKVGQPEAVAILVPHLADPATLDTALLAIARSGGLEAENVLERTERALAAKGAEKERWERIRYYRSQAFRTEEEKRRQAARKELP